MNRAPQDDSASPRSHHADRSKKLRVLHIISGDSWAGAEVQAFTLLSQLKTRVELHAAIMNEGELAQRLRDEGIPVTVLDESRHNSLFVLMALIKLARSFKPAIIHTHRQKENIFGAIAGAACRAKSLRTVHGDAEFIPSLIQRAYQGLNRFSGRHLQSALIAVSADLATKLEAEYPADKIRVIYNGIDAQAIARSIKPADFLGAAPDAMHVGLVGRLEPVKRVDIFLQMAALLLRQHPEIPWRFHVFGDGSQKDSLLELTEQLGINEYVTLHGHRTDIRDCIAGLRVMVMTSDHEGLPMAALESIALGTPLVAHNVGGLKEILADHPELLVNAHNAEGYAQAVIDATQTGKCTNLQLQPGFTAETNAEATHSLYKQILNNETRRLLPGTL